VSSAAIVSTGSVFVTTTSYTNVQLYALDLASGAVIWTAQVPGGPLDDLDSSPVPPPMSGFTNAPPPAISNDGSVVYAIGGPSGSLPALGPATLVAFDAENGTEVWTASFDPVPCNFWEPYVGPDDSIILIGDAGIWSVSPTGTTNWAIAAEGTHPNTPSTIGSNGEVYFGTNGPGVACVDANGDFQWEVFIDPHLMGIYLPLTLNNQDPLGTSLYAAIANQLTAYSAADGSERWSFTYPENISGALAVDPQANHIYVPAQDGSMVALNFDGSVDWAVQVSPGAPLCTPTVDNASTVLVTDADGMVYSLSPGGGQNWSIGTSIFGSNWNSVVSIGPGPTLYISAIYTVTALGAKKSTGKGSTVFNPYYNPGTGTVFLPWYIGYLMSQGLSLTQAIEYIISGHPLPVVVPRGLPFLAPGAASGPTARGTDFKAQYGQRDLKTALSTDHGAEAQPEE
jgi:outer membrane protein assembly factor BamB